LTYSLAGLCIVICLSSKDHLSFSYKQGGSLNPPTKMTPWMISFVGLDVHRLGCLHLDSIPPSLQLLDVAKKQFNHCVHAWIKKAFHLLTKTSQHSTQAHDMEFIYCVIVNFLSFNLSRIFKFRRSPFGK
jgi:hypothetical protein